MIVDVLRSSVEVVGSAVENISTAVVEIFVFIAFAVGDVVVVVVVVVMVVVMVVDRCGLVVCRVVSRELLFGSLTGILRRVLVRNNYFSYVHCTGCRNKHENSVMTFISSLIHSTFFHEYNYCSIPA